MCQKRSVFRQKCLGSSACTGDNELSAPLLTKDVGSVSALATYLECCELDVFLVNLFLYVEYWKAFEHA
jgi:hypothetical protein